MTNKEIEKNNAKINTINYLKSYNIDIRDYDLLQSLIVYLNTQDYDLILETVKSYLLNNNKLNYKEYKDIALSTPMFAN